MFKNILTKISLGFMVFIILFTIGTPIHVQTVYGQVEEPPATDLPPDEILETPTPIVATVSGDEISTETSTEIATDTETPPIETPTEATESTEMLLTTPADILETSLPTETPLVTETPALTKTANPVCYPLVLKVVGGEASLAAKTAPNCSGGYLAGTPVELNANLGEGVQVDGWKGTTDDAAKTTVNTWLASEAGEVVLALIPLSIKDENIVGGFEVSPEGKYPWIVALVPTGQSPLNQYCAGSLISTTLVLTAAHCVYGDSASAVDVVAGIHNLSTSTGYQRVHASKLIIHPSYTPSNDHDIALIKLQSAIILGGSGSTTVNTIPLVATNSIAGMNSIVAGWGKTEGGGLALALREVTLPIYSNSDCNNSARWGGAISDNMLCAGYDTGYYSACFADSGGPLIVGDASKSLAGIVSWGPNPCGQAMKPSVFTRVFNYRDWIYSYFPLTSIPSPVSPSGTISTLTPTYTWSKVTGATSYRLVVYDSTAAAYKIQTDVSASACGSTTCSSIPTITLTNGNSMKWKVLATNAAGSTAYSAYLSFLPSTATIPSVPTPSSPSGTISALNPTYTWSKVSGATAYGLVVYDSTTRSYVIQTNVSSSACGASICSYTGTSSLTNGHSMKWKVRASNSAGSSSYSAYLSFLPSTLSVPPVPTPSSPSGTISNLTPTFTWSKVSGATSYRLVIYDSTAGAYKVQTNVSSSACGSTICSYNTTTAFMNGNSMKWKVRASNSAGNSAYSAYLSFLPSTSSIPSIPTPVSPSGNIWSTNPTYTWTKVSGATSYQLAVYDTVAAAYVINQSLSNFDIICNTTNCSSIPMPGNMTSGHNYKWKVKAINTAGSSAYSSFIYFTTSF